MIALTNKLALVIDDSMTQCILMSALLKEEGYQVEIANDGAQGVEKYIAYLPDLVLMDINMPVMNGYEAAKKIKKLSADRLAPLLFITSLNTEQSFIDSIDAGGDGVLVRPFSPQVFKAKIKSLQRMGDLYQQVKNLQQEQLQDAHLAEIMMSELIESRNFAIDKIGFIKQPAAMFSGDIQLTALSPTGSIYILLGDFTGHGLRASIGAIPVAETFRSMTKKGFSILDIIAQINRQLYDLLPKDLFFAACFGCISAYEKFASVFNAGLPDGYIYHQDATIKQKFPSIHPPLGILPELLFDAQKVVVSIQESDRMVFISDGIVEARNEQGKEFGVKRFEQAAAAGIKNSTIAVSVLEQLKAFCQQMPQEDDISLIDVPCSGWLEEHIPQKASASESFALEETFYSTTPSWSWHLLLSDKLLVTVNPIPLVMNQINDIEGAGEHWHSLYTVITELFVNALDHGVLGLSSSLKDSPEGFTQYFNERAKRLKNLTEGFVRIELNYFPFTHGGKMIITIQDSGKGFNVLKAFKKIHTEQEKSSLFCGRGLDLINQLCDTLNYQENGTLVTATYVWQNGMDSNDI